MDLCLFVASGGRITKASNWICEAVFSYPEELPLERLDEYNDYRRQPIISKNTYHKRFYNFNAPNYADYT